MNDKTIITIVTTICIVPCYIAYVMVTHGDGIALASIVGAITGVGGYLYGKQNTKEEPE